MKDERITFRATNEFKKKLEILATKDNKTLSQYILGTLQEKIENEGLTDSQGQFLKLFDIAFKNSFEPYQKQLVMILNQNNFNTEWIVKILDLFMKHLKIPQTKDSIKTSFVLHPITEICKEKVLKEIRSLSANKKGIDVDD